MSRRRPERAGLPSRSFSRGSCATPPVYVAEALEDPHPTLAHFREFARRPDEWQAPGQPLDLRGDGRISAAIGIPLGFSSSASSSGRRCSRRSRRSPRRPSPLAGLRVPLSVRRERFPRSGGSAVTAPRNLLALSGRRHPARPRLLDVRLLLSLHRAGLARLDAPTSKPPPASVRRLRTTTDRAAAALPGPHRRGAADFHDIPASLAPYIFGGNFRVMTTRIVASRLTATSRSRCREPGARSVALLGLASCNARRVRDVAGAVRGLAPARRTMGRPGSS